MLLSAVSVLVVAQSSSEIPEGLMNNPVRKSATPRMGRQSFTYWLTSLISPRRLGKNYLSVCLKYENIGLESNCTNMQLDLHVKYLYRKMKM